MDDEEVIRQLLDSECCRAQRWRLTTRYHRYIIADKSNEGQDASL